jgi:hypothetical protein
VNIQAGEVRNERVSREEMGKWDEETKQREGAFKWARVDDESSRIGISRIGKSALGGIWV